MFILIYRKKDDPFFKILKKVMISVFIKYCQLTFLENQRTILEVIFTGTLVSCALNHEN